MDIYRSPDEWPFIRPVVKGRFQSKATAQATAVIKNGILPRCANIPLPGLHAARTAQAANQTRRQFALALQVRLHNAGASLL
jgi:hypothetical protein